MSLSKRRPVKEARFAKLMGGDGARASTGGIGTLDTISQFVRDPFLAIHSRFRIQVTFAISLTPADVFHLHLRWRTGGVDRTISLLLCIFSFQEEYFDSIEVQIAEKSVKMADNAPDFVYLSITDAKKLFNSSVNLVANIVEIRL